MAEMVKQERNPWMSGPTVLWVILTVIAAILLLVGVNTDSMTYDMPGMPPAHELAGIYYMVAGGVFALAILVVGMQLAVGAIRWYLDPASRELTRPTTHEAAQPATTNT